MSVIGVLVEYSVALKKNHILLSPTKSLHMIVIVK